MNHEISEREALGAMSRLLSPETTASILTSILRHPHKCRVIVILPPAEGQTYGAARGRSFPSWNVDASSYIEKSLKVGVCLVYYQGQWWVPAPSPS